MGQGGTSKVGGMNPLEELVARFNSDVFVREFTFARSHFTLERRGEVEFADHVVRIGDVLAIYQLKERHSENLSGEALAAWFERKVLKGATKQVRDTLRYLNEHPNISITNDRGHSLNMVTPVPPRVYKIIVHDPHAPISCVPNVRLFYQSREAGFIHIFNVTDYLNVTQILITPAEIWEYLDFREATISRFNAFTDEKALVGQYLVGADTADPDEAFSAHVDRLLQDTAAFDIRHIMSGLGDRIRPGCAGSSESDYYRFLVEMARLNRLSLGHFRKRLDLCVEAAMQNEFREPYRFVSPQTGCGFLFVPFTAEQPEHDRRVFLENLTRAAKYDQHTERQVGIGVAYEAPMCLVDWIFVDGPWEPNEEIERRLRECYPFRRLQSARIDRYQFAD